MLWPAIGFAVLFVLLLALRGLFVAIEAAEGQLDDEQLIRAWRGAHDGPREGEPAPADIHRFFAGARGPLALTILSNAALLTLAVLLPLVALELLASPEQRPAGWLTRVVTLVAIAPLILVFADALPRRIGRAHADRLIACAFPMLKPLALLKLPATLALTGASSLILRLWGSGRVTLRTTLSREDLIEIVEDGAARRRTAPTSKMSPTSGREMIAGIFELRETLVREVMRPLNEVAAVRLPSTQRYVRQLARDTGYTRLPVHRDRIVDLIGYINILEIVYANDPERPLTDFIHEAYYVPETKRVDELLREFLRRNIKVAIAVDEHGGCSGFVTREDLLEEIVGEIDDEFDPGEPGLERLGPGRYSCPAAMDVDDLNDALQLEIFHPEADTVGGIVYAQLGHIPQAGEAASYQELEFRVVEMERYKILSVEIQLPLSR